MHLDFPSFSAFAVQLINGPAFFWLGGAALVALLGMVGVFLFEDKKPRLFRTGIATVATGIVLMLGSVVVPAVTQPSAIPQLQQQAARVYGLKLTADQADNLTQTTYDLNGQLHQQLGSSYVKTASGIQEITLVYIDNKFVLVKDGTHTELPHVS